MVHNPIYCEPLYDKVGGPPQIAIPPVPPSASDTQSITSSPPVGTPTPLLSTHYAHQVHHGQKFIYEGKHNTVLEQPRSWLSILAVAEILILVLLIKTSSDIIISIYATAKIISYCARKNFQALKILWFCTQINDVPYFVDIRPLN